MRVVNFSVLTLGLLISFCGSTATKPNDLGHRLAGYKDISDYFNHLAEGVVNQEQCSNLLEDYLFAEAYLPNAQKPSKADFDKARDKCTSVYPSLMEAAKAGIGIVTSKIP